MYIELHARSAFSFLEGASLPETLIATGANFHMPAMALLDRDGVYGSPRFHMAAKKTGLKAHIGAEVTCEPSGHGSTRISTDSVKHRKTSVSNPSMLGGIRLPLLVVTRCGYQNLCRLITRMKLRAVKGEGSVSEEELREHAAGLICLTGGDDGPLAFALKNGGMEAARNQVARLIEILGCSNVYVELQRGCLYSPPTACVMPRRGNASYAMCSPPSATIARWPRQDACWRATPSVI